MDHVIENSRVPVGVFEYNPFYKKTFMNNRILKILGISDADENNDALSNRIRKKLEEAENHPVDARKISL